MSIEQTTKEISGFALAQIQIAEVLHALLNENLPVEVAAKMMDEIHEQINRTDPETNP